MDVTWNKINHYWQFIILSFAFLIGLILKLTVMTDLSSSTIIDYVADILLTSVCAGAFTSLILKYNEEKVLREVLGVSKSTSLIQEIEKFNPLVDYLIEDRKSIWTFEENKGDRLTIINHDVSQILILKNGCNFHFRRGLTDSECRSIEIKNISTN